MVHVLKQDFDDNRYVIKIFCEKCGRELGYIYNNGGKTYFQKNDCSHYVWRTYTGLVKDNINIVYKLFLREKIYVLTKK